MHYQTNRKQHPPKLASRLLTWLIRDDLAEEVLGDLEEKFYAEAEKKSLTRAKLNYWYQVLNYMRPFAIRTSSNSKQFVNSTTTLMFRHNLLLFYRNSRRYKSSFFINLTGLATGLAALLLIYLWVRDEISMDKFHAKNDQLYSVMLNFPLGGGGILTIESTPGLLAESFKNEMPEVKEVAVATPSMGGRGTKGILSTGSNQIKADELFVSSNYFNVFSYELLEGNRDYILPDRYSVALSDEMALKLFGTTENIIGKAIEWSKGNLAGQFIISGIFKKPPPYSSVQFDVLFSYELFFEHHAELLKHWGNNGPATYLVLKEGTDIEQFNEKIENYITAKYNATGGDPQYLSGLGTLFLQPYSDRYLYNHFENGVQAGGRIDYVRLFSVIALFILLIACINFVNLSTARGSRRMKEVGIKKAIGAEKKELIFQFISESVFLTFISVVMAILIAAILFPFFNELTEKQLYLEFDAELLIAIAAITFITGIVSGSYPALYLSNFKACSALKGNIRPHLAEGWVRKGLVVFQFTASIILITLVMVTYRQIEYIHSKNLGYDKDNIIQIAKEGKLRNSSEPFISEVKNLPGVIDASSFGHNLTGEHGGTSGVSWEGKDPNQKIDFGNLEVDYGLLELLGIELMEGRTFSKELGAEKTAIIFNEAAITAMGLKDPVGKTIKLWGEDKQIIGVVKNFHFESLYEEVKPCFIRLASNNRYILVKIQSGRESEAIDNIQEFYQAYNQGVPFEYKFLDDDYQALYASENRLAVLSKYFAGITILISCLGLFGLAAFTAEKRTKEIGVRKILGSGEWDIIYLLSSDFTKMVIVAIMIALPVSCLIAREWLRNFAYAINLEWWFFIGAAVAALAIAWFTVGVQTFKAARVNPVECLRDE